MDRRLRPLAALLLAATLLSACQQVEEASSKKAEPAKVEKIGNTGLSRVILTPKAAERIGITTARVRKVSTDGVARRVIPYSAVIYDHDAKTWTYTNPEPLVFVRRAIKIDSIEGDRAILAEGPPAGQRVVAVGAALLFGTEFGVGK